LQLGQRAPILQVAMLPINVIWIDSDQSFVDALLQQKMPGDSFFHFKDAGYATFNSIDWRQTDLLVLDYPIDDAEAFEMVLKVRQKKENLPVLMITANASKELCIQAINASINGFIEKPVSTEGFAALMNRFRPKNDELKICNDRKAIFSQNKWIDLTSTEYKILETLKTARRRLTRSELQAAVWPTSSISENNLDTHLTNLKRKIPELNACLNVKRGLGYFLDLKINK
jgi:DNA-binding response OmpR family regulator